MCCRLQSGNLGCPSLLPPNDWRLALDPSNCVLHFATEARYGPPVGLLLCCWERAHDLADGGKRTRYLK